jgi:hypothetical protein
MLKISPRKEHIFLNGAYSRNKSNWFNIVEPTMPPNHTNWERFKLAHPGFDSYYPRTFAFKLAELFIPPNDLYYSIAAHQTGIMQDRKIFNGADFLYNGNYVHPNLHVVNIGQHQIKEGRIYYPGMPWDLKLILASSNRDWLEILSKTNLEEDPYNLKDGQIYQIELLCQS